MTEEEKTIAAATNEYDQIMAGLRDKNPEAVTSARVLLITLASTVSPPGLMAMLFGAFEGARISREERLAREGAGSE